MFDLRDYVDHYGLPERMDGMRALDVGTWDGFWAFEMERRGARGRGARPRRRARPRLAAAPAARRRSRTRRAATASGCQGDPRLQGRARRTAASTDATPEELGDVRRRLLRLGAHPPARPAARARADRRPLPRHVHLGRGVRPAAASSPFPVSRYLPTATRRSSSGCRASARGGGCCGPPASTASSSAASSRRGRGAGWSVKTWCIRPGAA